MTVAIKLTKLLFPAQITFSNKTNGFKHFFTKLARLSPWCKVDKLALVQYLRGFYLVLGEVWNVLYGVPYKR